MKHTDELLTPQPRSLRKSSDNGDAVLLGEKLRRLREQRGLSLRALAEKVGVTATALHSWETGRRNPKHKHLQAFANAFRLTKSELLQGAGADEAANGPLAGDASPLAEEIAKCKVRIAAVAGTLPERVRIIIEV